METNLPAMFLLLDYIFYLIWIKTQIYSVLLACQLNLLKKIQGVGKKKFQNDNIVIANLNT